MALKVDARLFRSILARRFFILFVLSALVPTTILAVVAYPYVSDQLFAQSSERLWRTAKSESLSVHERLLFLESQLASVATMLAACEIPARRNVSGSATSPTIACTGRIRLTSARRPGSASITATS